MNILLINQPLNNRGDEAAHKALVRTLSKDYPDSHIEVLFIDANPDSVEQFEISATNIEYINLLPRYDSHSISYRIYRRFILDNTMKLLKSRLLQKKSWKCCVNPKIMLIKKKMKQADIIINSPGGICMGGFQYWPHIALLSIAKSLHKPIVYYGRSFGPFPTETKDNIIFKEISLDLLNYFKFISIRDSKTEQLADSLGFEYVKTVDTAFLEVPRVNIPIEIRKSIGDGEYMVFVPNLLIWHYAYRNIPKQQILKFYLEMIQCIVELYPSLKIVMLPQTFNYKTELMDDINLFKELSQKTSSENIIVISDQYSSDIQQTIISSAKFVVGARYHSVVFAINNNVPFVALSYEHKIAGLLNTLDKTDRMIDITGLSDVNFDYDSFYLSFKKMIVNLSRDENTATRARNIAYDCFCKMLKII